MNQKSCLRHEVSYQIDAHHDVSISRYSPISKELELRDFLLDETL